MEKINSSLEPSALKTSGNGSKPCQKGMIRSVTIFCRPDLPDVTVSVFAEAYVKLNAMRDDLKSVEDGHVMYDTVQRAKHYTGERTDF